MDYFNLINWSSLVDVLVALAAIGAGGGVMSLITSALVGANWPGAAKGLVAFLLCVPGAFLPIVIAGVDLTNMVLVVPLMWMGSQIFYRAWFKPHGIAPWIETLFNHRRASLLLRPGELAPYRQLVTRVEGRACTMRHLGRVSDRRASRKSQDVGSGTELIQSSPIPSSLLRHVTACKK